MPFIGHIKPHKPCTSPEHQPPSAIVLEPGIHSWECPGCGELTTVNVPTVGL
jgi:hypothetical protein